MSTVILIIALMSVITYYKIQHISVHSYNERKQKLLLNYSRSALLFRDEVMCNDGCAISSLQNGTFTLMIHDSLNLHQNGEEHKLRSINFPNCEMSKLHKFGLGTNGNAVVSRYIFRDYNPKEDFCTIEEGPFDAILLEDTGRLKFIKY